MKNIFSFSLLLLVFGLKLNAQCPANDSVFTGSNAISDVFYSLSNHIVSTVPATDWHMAFSVQHSDHKSNPASGVAIRVNGGGNGTQLKKLTGANAAKWRSIDTAGFSALPDLTDSDSTWNLSAFTKGYPVSSDPFNFVWGEYDQVLHNVEGTNVFILYNQNAGWYKKVFIKKCEYDTLWNFIISNIDNSDSNNVQFLKKTYMNKLFVYYNAATNQLIDREPVKTSWDLLWTRYRTYVAGPTSPLLYTVAGVLSNPAVTVEQNNGKKCNEVWLTGRTSKVDPRISAIGYDWKTFNGGTYDVKDTVVYFVKSQDTKMYKLTYKSYIRNTGESLFNIYEATTGVGKTESKHPFSVYPNPADNVLMVCNNSNALQKFNVYAMNGDCLTSIEIAADSTGIIDVAAWAKGLYMVVGETGFSVKLMVE